jgi:2-acylglycerol O-acyltransferase 2
LQRLFRDYFPAEIVAEERLDPEKKYLFGLHPHGVIGISAWANFFNTVSPVLRDINYRIVTLASNFWIPITREWLLFLGLIGSDKKGILHALNSGLSVAIVVGGAAEALEIHDTYHGIVLDRRKGFIELAIRTGAHLVPVFSFGENALYNTFTENEHGTKVRHWQERMKSALGWTLPLVHGRGIWNYSWGILPFRKPITTVVGKPIPVEHIKEPTQEQIDHYHELYKAALLALHEKWRVKVGETQRLRIIA